MPIEFMSKQESWLAGLKTGDLVCLVGPRSRNLYPVKRTTQNRIVVSSSVQFRRSDGREVGAIRPRYIEQPSADDKLRGEARMLREFIRRKVGGAIHIGKLRAVAIYLGHKPVAK